ncbi:PH domain-containing protein [Flavobacterium sp.]|uniref:PH domain-containing protein n=1 Tax=Flavobacterium sp. TaxID=239 RepID=UPI0026021F1C|nr:PH domain-containing protein [Flavobacterium sp.]MDD3003527.1 PH domain-containing protein [Flavobacterium sp.]
MDHFTNPTLDISQLPQYEAVQFQPLQSSYWRVIVINMLVTFLILAIGVGVLSYLIPEVALFSLYLWIALGVLTLVSFLFSRIAFLKKGFAFRAHDVLYKNGVLATNTIVIPYNRVQHVALHEGWLSRYFGLAKIEIFTAGGSSSDIKIPGIQKEQAENIKQLLMGKIQQKN